MAKPGYGDIAEKGWLWRSTYTMRNKKRMTANLTAVSEHDGGKLFVCKICRYG